MKKYLLASLILVSVLSVGMLLGRLWSNKGGTANYTGTRDERRALYYVDPMNPAHTSDKPGIAPCGMALVPIYEEDESTESGAHDLSAPMSPGAVKITPQKQQIIGVRVGTVEIASGTKTFRALGRVSADENRIYRISTNNEGRTVEVYGSTTGSFVEKNQILAIVYSKDFAQKQLQYLNSLISVGLQQPGAEQPQAQDSPPRPTRESVRQLAYGIGTQAQVYKADLLNMGVAEAQLQEITRTRQYAEYIEIRSPVAGTVLARNISPNQVFDKGAEFYKIADLSKVWIVADVFGREASYIRAGNRARVYLPDNGNSFDAVVSDVPQQFDGTTRALKVRLDADNPANVLRPDMVVEVEFQITFPRAVTIPAEAVLDSGLRKSVFVEIGNGFFDPRPVKVGWHFGDKVEIVEGLMPGERIVVSGNFLLDSESKMKLSAAGLYGTPEKDPVCGVEVYPNKAKPAGLTSKFEDKAYYFCSPECKDAFDRKQGDPARIPPIQAAPQGKPAAPATDSTGGIFKDPVCGSPVSSRAARAAGLASDYEGRTYYFCGRQCKEQFDKARLPRHPVENKSLAPVNQSREHEGHGHD